MTVRPNAKMRRRNPTHYLDIAQMAEYEKGEGEFEIAVLERYYGDVEYFGRRVVWIGPEGSMIKLLPEQLEPIEGNIFNYRKVAAVRDALLESNDRVELRPGYCMLQKVTADTIRESIEYHEEGDPSRLTTGDEDLDEWLVNPKGAIREGLFRTQKEAQASLRAAVRANQGHLGMWLAQIRDGNHRAFGAVAAGERYVYLQVADNDLQDMRETLARGRRGYSKFSLADARELREMLE